LVTFPILCFKGNSSENFSDCDYSFEKGMMETIKGHKGDRYLILDINKMEQ